MKTRVRLACVCAVVLMGAGCPGETAPSVLGLWDGVSYLPDKAVSTWEATFFSNGTVEIFFPGTGATRTMSYSQNGTTVRMLGSEPINDAATGVTHAAQDTLLVWDGNDYMYGDTYVTFFFEDGSEALTGYWTDELYRR